MARINRSNPGWIDKRFGFLGGIDERLVLFALEIETRVCQQGSSPLLEIKVKGGANRSKELDFLRFPAVRGHGFDL